MTDNRRKIVDPQETASDPLIEDVNEAFVHAILLHHANPLRYPHAAGGEVLANDGFLNAILCEYFAPSSEEIVSAD